MLWSRIGTPFTDPENGQAFDSGTAYEFEKAYDAHTLHGLPFILLYRKTALSTTIDPDQQLKVDAFFKRFTQPDSSFKGYFKTYESVEAFEDMIFEHIEHILTEHPPEKLSNISAKLANRIEIIEESRRVDAAIAQKLRVGQPTELLVQICLPTSGGLRQEILVNSSADPEVYEDIRGGELAIAFAKEHETNVLPSKTVQIEVEAPNFVVEESLKNIEVRHGIDSIRVIFLLTPIEVQERSIIVVKVRTTTIYAEVIELGSFPLKTEVTSPNSGIAKKVWL
jgi:hypothetical protein